MQQATLNYLNSLQQQPDKVGLNLRFFGEGVLGKLTPCPKQKKSFPFALDHGRTRAPIPRNGVDPRSGSNSSFWTSANPLR